MRVHAIMGAPGYKEGEEMTMKSDSVSIDFGALVDPIGKQLEEQGIVIPMNDTERLNEIAHSIVFLHLQGIISGSVRDVSERKLLKKVGLVIERRGQPAYCKHLRWFSSVEGDGDYYCALGNKTSSEYCEKKERCSEWELGVKI